MAEISYSTFNAKLSRVFWVVGALALGATILYWGAPRIWPAIIQGYAQFVQLLLSLKAVLLSLQPAIVGAVLSLFVGLTHQQFWRRAKWNGADWSEKAMPALVRRGALAGEVAALLGTIGVLVIQLHGAAERTWLENTLGVLSLIPVFVVLMHQIAMLDRRSRLLKETPVYQDGGVALTAMLALVLATALGLSFYAMPGESSLWGAGGKGLVYFIGFFATLCILDLPVLGPPPGYLYTIDESNATVGS